MGNMAKTPSAGTPRLPFPIYRPSMSIERYFLFDVDVITWLRRTHRILGVLVGTLPQIPQQNVFLGLPLQLMAEEARLLVDKGLAYISLDHQRHLQGLSNPALGRIETLQKALEQEGTKAALVSQKKKTASKSRALHRSKPEDSPKAIPAIGRSDEAEHQDDESMALFGSVSRPQPDAGSRQSATDQPIEPWIITPTTTDGLLNTPPENPSAPPPNVKSASYSVFRLLHQEGYFLSPGLRFGCQYMAYPGDPLRFHSHFLAVGADWDEELDLLDIVGGGRLGTGVKKGFLLGGPAPNVSHDEDQPSHSIARAFCIEWGGM